MSLTLKTVDAGGDLAAVMHGLGQRARAAARALALAPAGAKERGARRHGGGFPGAAPAILAANAEDVAEAQAAARRAFLDRLSLNERRRGDGRGRRGRAASPDPVGAVMDAWDAAERDDDRARRVPLGVIGVIYESRPNVTADAGALCLKAGNAVILRGGSDSFRSARAIHAALAAGPARGRAAGGRRSARADPRPRRRRRDAGRASTARST